MKTSTKLVFTFAVILGLFFSISSAQESQLSLQACGDDAQIISQSSEADKSDIVFSTSESMAKCFNNLDNQMANAGWERLKGDNNIYKSDFYRIAYTSNGQTAMLVLRQNQGGYRVILDF